VSDGKVRQPNASEAVYKKINMKSR
jgi:hypothetical protein